MTDKINVLFLASWYPNELKPQNGNFIRRHAEAVSEFCNVSVIHVRARVQKERISFDIKNHNNVQEYICYYKKHTNNIPLVSKIIKVKQKLNAYKKTYKKLSDSGFNPNITHVNVILPAGVFALFLKRKYIIPFIVTEHWTKFQQINSDIISKTEKKLILKISKKTSTICPVSENLKSALIRFGIKSEFEVIPNVVNTEIFFPPTQKEDIKQKKLLHISHLEDRHKNISGMLNVIKRLSSDRSDFTFTLSGNRNLEIHKKYAETIGIPKEIIRFEGEKTSEEVAEAMREHDIFVMFSNYENLPCVISEAQMCGMPVISSNVGGVSEMIDESNGIIVEKGNEQELFEKLNFLIDNIDKYSKLLISMKAQKSYSYTRVGKLYHNLYQKIIK